MVAAANMVEVAALVGEPPIRRVFLDSIRWVSDRGVKLLPHFISDLTILHADDGSPHADWIFERT